MAAVELVRERRSREPFPAALGIGAKVRAAALERGVILRASGDVIAICPPLVVTEKEIDRLVGVLDESIGALGGDDR
jgi:4-aminobutyrate--pyruvate transaminase